MSNVRPLIEVPWGTFPTDITSPMPTQVCGSSPDTQKARTDAPEEKRKPDHPREQKKSRSAQSLKPIGESSSE